MLTFFSLYMILGIWQGIGTALYARPVEAKLGRSQIGLEVLNQSTASLQPTGLLTQSLWMNPTLRT